jgi:hypothetical protein
MSDSGPMARAVVPFGTKFKNHPNSKRRALRAGWLFTLEEAAGENTGTAGVGPHSCCRHLNSWLAWIPAARATSDATAPGAIAAATIRSFSARDHRRRRCTDVITSTCVLVIGPALGLVL